ncbi:MAG: hypothetical protein KJ726_04950 [Verrucomicrobia bacterium]|nr:hypothetical protein [Verrucomicrobiota bacterium]MBU1909377.1 hypothetical protein [Verrucomicrobiota bacterium]
MKQHEKMLAALLLAALLASASADQPPDFERYRVILDRKPFGVAPPPTPIVVPPLTAEQSFARTIRMSTIWERGGIVRVGLIDSRNNRSFFLSVGEVEDGIELVSADCKNEEAVLRKGGEMAVLKLASGEIQPLTQDQQQARLTAEQAQRLSYAERRKERERQRQQPPPPPPQPVYTGAELEKHLQEYQMEVIRQGLPPLPLPLTPAMDAQLVAEGVLPPIE